MVDHTIAETLYRIGESGDAADYFAVMGTRLRVQTRPLDPRLEGTTEIEIPLGDDDVDVSVLIEDNRHATDPFARTFTVKADDWTVFMEADHRGPEHGVDAWLGEDAKPDAVVTELELVNGGGDRD